MANSETRAVEFEHLRAVDSTLELISAGRGSPDSDSSHTTFYMAVLHARGQTDAPDDPVTDLFSTNVSSKARHFTAVCLLRLLATDPDAFDSRSFRVGAFDLFDDTFGKSLYPAIGLKTDQQTFEKQRVLVDVVGRMKEEMDGVLRSLESTAAIKSFRQNYMRALRRQSSWPLLNAFVPRELTSARLDALFDSVQVFATAEDVALVDSYDRASAELQGYASDASEVGTFYCVRYAAGLAERLKRVIEREYTQNAVSQPAVLRLESAEKEVPIARRPNRARAPATRHQ